MGSGQRPSRVGTLSVLTLLALAACGSPPSTPGADSDDGTGGPSTAGSRGGAGDPGTQLTACELVTPADIDAALNLESGTATEGTHRELEGEDPAANECSYLAQGWGGLVVMVNPTIGASLFEDVLGAAGDQAEEFEIGDGAVWLTGAERGYFLSGSVLVTITITSLRDDVPFREPTIELGEAAVDRL